MLFLSAWQFLGVEKIQNGSRCHGNQGAKNVKFTPNFTNFAVMFPVTSTSSTRCGCCSYQVSLILDIPTKFHEV
jgi:hypothetical protein